MNWYKLYMPIVNLIKLLVIWLTDFINWCYYPFELVTSYPGNQSNVLSTTEAQFAFDLDARFIQPTGEFIYTLPKPADSGDTALFQGLCTGMKILRGDDVTNEVAFIQTLFPNNRLIRGYETNGTINDTTSNDSATGMLFFFYCALEYGTPALKIQASNILIPWLRQLKADAWSLCDQSGAVTEYGALDDGIFTDPLRITILLGLLAVSMGLQSTEFSADYQQLYDKYKLILAYPKVKALWWDTKYDTHRAAINMHVLLKITGDSRYAKGLARIWRITKKENNAWVYTLCAPALDHSEDAIVSTMLSTFDFAKRLLGDIQSLNDGQPSVYWPIKLPYKDLFNSILRCKYPLPLNKRGSQDFFWQRDMNSLDEWVGNTTADVYHSGLDFLICYHLAKQQGII